MKKISVTGLAPILIGLVLFLSAYVQPAQPKNMVSQDLLIKGEVGNCYRGATDNL